MEHVLSLSYGKDSLACLGAIEQLGWPLDRIVHAEVWATDTIPAELPPMVDFKAKADEIIHKRWGIRVEHFRADVSYQDVFYRHRTYSRFKGLPVKEIYGFPIMKGAWCNDRLKMAAIKKAKTKNSISYVGIASDEPLRIERHQNKPDVKMPLVEAGWTEAMCREWCERNDLLSPIYTTATRGGCWFCHNQGVQQLRQLRRDYPELWQLLLKWDADSPVSFKPDGHTVHDFDERFRLEDELLIDPAKTFRWEMLTSNLQYRMDI